jgi:hypothetical protein
MQTTRALKSFSWCCGSSLASIMARIEPLAEEPRIPGLFKRIDLLGAKTEHVPRRRTAADFGNLALVGVTASFQSHLVDKIPLLSTRRTALARHPFIEAFQGLSFVGVHASRSVFPSWPYPLKHAFNVQHVKHCHD